MPKIHPATAAMMRSLNKLSSSAVATAKVPSRTSAPTVAGSPVRVDFAIDGVPVSIADDVTSSIPAGGMALVTAVRGVSGPATWTAAGIGAHTVTATVDPANGTAECVEGNNVTSAVIQVVSVPPPNLALNKSVSVTSIEGSGLEGKYAVDGNMGTRWSSAFSDPQTLVVDLGARAFIDDVTLYWEAAYGKEYSIRIADGGGPWVEVAHVTGGDGGIDKVPVAMNGSKIMMLGMQRATAYGYSLYEIQVHGGEPTGVAAGRSDLPSAFVLDACYPNPFNGSTVIGYQVPVAGLVHLAVYDMLGREVAVVVNGPVAAGTHTARFDAGGIASGTYLLRMEAGGRTLTGKVLLIR